jgi:hypothetical protein
MKWHKQIYVVVEVVVIVVVFFFFSRKSTCIFSNNWKKYTYTEFDIDSFVEQKEERNLENDDDNV